MKTIKRHLSLFIFIALFIHVSLSLSLSWQMAIAAVAHVYVFPVEPYCFLPVSEYGKVTTETTKEALKLEEGDKEKSAVLEKKKTKVEATGTSVTESVQDIVVEGGQHVSSVPAYELFHTRYSIFKF